MILKQNHLPKPLAKTDTEEYNNLLVKRTFIGTSGDRN
jgi:hypothetical protein